MFRLCILLLLHLATAAQAQIGERGYKPPPATASTIAPGTDLSNGVVTATGGSTTRTEADRAANVFNIMDGWGGTPGAKCDSTTNDDAAINATLTAAFNSVAYQNNNAVRITGPSGNGTKACLMNSLNLTQFNKGTGSNTRPRVELEHMTLLCTGVGNVCLDGLGASLIKIHDVSIRGDTGAAAPEICIQFGSNAVNASNAWNQLDRVNCNNEFTFTALYNMSSEANQYTDVMMVNNHTSSGPIGTVGAITAGSGGSSGFYNNVPLTGGSGAGALGNFTVAAGGVTAFSIAYEGRDYVAGDVLSAASGNIGNTTGFSIPVVTTKTYSVVLDGQNHWRSASAFTTQTTPPDTWDSLTLVTFLDANIRQGSTTGGGVWAGWTGGTRFINSYVTSGGPSCVDIYDNGITKTGIPGPNWGLHLGINCESATAEAILFLGTHTTQALQGFRFAGYHLAPYMFATAPGITSVALNGSDIDLAFGSNAGVTTAPMFASAKLFSGSGKVTVPDAVVWNAPASWSGTIVPGGSSTPPNLGPVDIVGSAAIAMSCDRQLSRTYAGPLCKFIRASDSAQLDIYSDVNGNRDRQAYTAFCAGTTCSVVTAYDQSGNTNNFTQGTGASQPVFTTSSSILGGRGAMTFGDASAYAMTATAAASINDIFAAGGYISTVVNVTANATAADRLLFKSNGGTTGFDIRNNTGGTSYTFVDGTGNWATTPGQGFGNFLYDWQYNASSLSNVPAVGVNGNALSLGSSTQPSVTPPSDSGQNLILGNNAATGGSRGYPGYISEVVAWKITPSAAQLEAVRRNQAAYYGIASVN